MYKYFRERLSSSEFVNLGVYDHQKNRRPLVAGSGCENTPTFEIFESENRFSEYILNKNSKFQRLCIEKSSSCIHFHWNLF